MQKKPSKQGFSLSQAVSQVTKDDTGNPDLTFRELAVAYAADCQGSSINALNKWIAFLGDVRAWDVASETLERSAEAMRSHGYAESTINRNLSEIGMAYRWAKRRRLSPRGFRSPTLDVHREPEAIRVVSFTDAEHKRLMDACHMIRDRRFLLFVYLVSDSGARKSEILERRWSDFNLEARTITVNDTKTGRPRILTYSEEAGAILRRIFKTHPTDGMPFESARTRGKPVNFRKSWVQVTKAIGRPELHIHDLRHFRAAKMLKSGTSLAVVAQVLGHSSLVSHKRYAHLETATLHEKVADSWI